MLLLCSPISSSPFSDYKKKASLDIKSCIFLPSLNIDFYATIASRTLLWSNSLPSFSLLYVSILPITVLSLMILFDLSSLFAVLTISFFWLTSREGCVFSPEVSFYCALPPCTNLISSLQSSFSNQVYSFLLCLASRLWVSGRIASCIGLAGEWDLDSKGFGFLISLFVTLCPNWN